MGGLLQLGEAGYRLSLDGRLEATLNPGGVRLLIDVRGDTMSLGPRSVRTEPRDRLFKDNELYIGAARLSALFDSRILVDWVELTVTFVDAEKLPTGRRVRSQRGLLVTNAPYLRPTLLGATRYDGQLDAGWTIEAYRGGDLVALDSTDARGRFAVALPVRYGENPVDFIAYGPLGEIREFNSTYHVLSELLPARQFEYGLSAGWCTTPACRATANLDLRYGVTERWTIRAGVEQFWRDGLGNRTHPYVATVLNPTNAWAVSVEGVGGASAAVGVQFEPSLNLRF